MPARRAKPKPTRPLDPPRLQEELDDVDAGTLADDTTWRGAALTGDATGLEVDGVDISGSRLDAVLLTGTRLDGAHISDTVFDSCDLSGAIVEEGRVDRVEFRSCRMLGFLAPLTQFRDVRFVDCRLDESNLRMGTSDHVTFELCSMRAVDLYEARWEVARFFDCDLTAARVEKARMPGVRLHGSRVDDLVGADALRGAVIDSGQLVPFGMRVMAALGITIDDDRDPPPAGSPGSQPPARGR